METIGKSEILEILSNEPERWFTIRDIYSQAESNRSSVYKTIRSLLKAKYIEIRLSKDQFIWEVKIKNGY